MRRFLILQLRPETDASDAEYASFLKRGHLAPEQTLRIRVDQQDLPEDLDPLDFAGVIVGGGPGCVSDPEDSKPPQEARVEAQIMALMPRILTADHPFMGCCYGLGILASHLGGAVSKAQYGEPVGPTDCTLTPDGMADPLLQGLPAQFQAFVGHKEAVQDLPPGCAHLVTSAACPYQMVRHGRNVYATQFHPEKSSEQGERVLQNFLNL